MTPEILVCHIPASTVTNGGSNRVNAPLHRVAIGSFYMAVVPLTNRQFAPFISAGGYETEALWTDAGWRWQSHHRHRHPAFWLETRFNHADQALVGVTWYEATAYANWLHEQTGVAWALPTEVEWEAAARLFAPASDLNTAEIGSGRPRMYSPALSMTTPIDLLGNVWEWCSTRWGRNWQNLDYPYPYDPDDGREDISGSYARIIRGGSWFDPRDAATPLHRARYLPGSRASNIGFRLIYRAEAV